MDIDVREWKPTVESIQELLESVYPHGGHVNKKMQTDRSTGKIIIATIGMDGGDLKVYEFANEAALIAHFEKACSNMAADAVSEAEEEEEEVNYLWPEFDFLLTALPHPTLSLSFWG